MRRYLLGILAIASIIAAVVLMVLDVNAFVANSSLRIGLVLAALWLAMPQLHQMSRWFRNAAIVVAVVAAAASRYALILLPLLALMWLFGPRSDKPKTEQPQQDPRG